MKKIFGMFLLVWVFTGFGNSLMSNELVELDLEIVKTPVYKEVGGFWYVYMDLTCVKSEIDAKFKIFIDECRKQGIKSHWFLSTWYSWSENDNDVIRWSEGMVVPENTQCNPPLKLAKLEKFKAWVYTHTGSLETSELAKSNKLLSDFLIEKGLKEIRPNYEVIRANPPQAHLWYMVEEK